MGRVVIFGSLSQDLHFPMARHPRSGETVMSGDIEYRFGGKGANQAVAAARAGAQSVFVGKVGDDPQGHEYIERLGSFGVDTSKMEVVADKPTGTALIMVDEQGESMIVVAPGANHAFTEADLAKLADLGPGDVLLMPLELPLELIGKAALQVAGQGARVIINLAPYAPLPPEVLAACDPVVCNEHEAQLLADSGVTVDSLLVTLGANGSRWGDVSVDSPKVTPLDATGAGDAYCGTLGAALSQGLDRAEAMRRASEAAAQRVQYIGAQPDGPDSP